MRNGSSTWTSIVLLLTIVLAGGCAAEPKSKSDLSGGYKALEAQQFDAALAAADTQLARSSTGRGTAEAYYLRGRAFERPTASSTEQARSNLRAARDAYLQALRHDPASKLEAYIRTSLGNVNYFLEDYPAAVREWTEAYKRLDDPTTQSWVLYRTALCQQRMGQFEQADKTFALVQETFPNTVPAQRAREFKHARGFTVQLATYADARNAQQAMDILRREGVIPTSVIDPQGRSIVRVGPFQSYTQAQAMKQRYAQRYPDALIWP